ncbi:hypothetical protein EYF80_038623 [Liparis tanakae]|uniref:Uncharacterized protein n=1 Tax=Liparis tanakae TaxID=230148 RepID=A0A4Z2GE29_9TELE|nr:hypothetical protein EYF80_038623 [Liparis tanakae]
MKRLQICEECAANSSPKVLSRSKEMSRSVAVTHSWERRKEKKKRTDGGFLGIRTPCRVCSLQSRGGTERYSGERSLLANGLWETLNDHDALRLQRCQKRTFKYNNSQDVAEFNGATSVSTITGSHRDLTVPTFPLHRVYAPRDTFLLSFNDVEEDSFLYGVSYRRTDSPSRHGGRKVTRRNRIACHELTREGAGEGQCHGGVHVPN